MFFQPRDYQYHPHYTAGSSRRMREVTAFEDQLIEAREQLVAWAKKLEETEMKLARKEEELRRRGECIDEMRQQLEERDNALRKRVAILDAADEKEAQRSQAALQAAAATVIQRAGQRFLASRKARQAVNGLRKLDELHGRLEEAQTEFKQRGNTLLLEDTLTKLLEQADGIATRGSQVLRQRRKEFVRSVMAILGEEGLVDEDVGYISSGSTSSNEADSNEADMEC